MVLYQGYTGLVQRPPTDYSPIPPDGRPPRHGGPSYSRSEENQPLLGGQTGRPPLAKSDTTTPLIKFLALGLAFVLLLLIGGWGCGYTYAYDPMNKCCDPSERNRIRKEWALEASTYRQEITKLLHQKDIMQREWVAEHNNLMEFRRDVELEYQRWKQQEQQWEQQREQQRHQWDKERRQWWEEREKHDQEEREHERRLIQWGPLQKEQECDSYGTARYQAHLQYVPPGWDQYTACTETPVQIHQTNLLPTRCQINTVSAVFFSPWTNTNYVPSTQDGRVVGVWIVDFEEPACKPWWRDIKDHVSIPIVTSRAPRLTG